MKGKIESYEGTYDWIVKKSPYIFESSINAALGGKANAARMKHGSFSLIITDPTSQPTGSPSGQPSVQPSSKPTKNAIRYSKYPSSLPSGQPSSQPSRQPTHKPTKVGFVEIRRQLWNANATELSFISIPHRKLRSEDITFSFGVEVFAETYYNQGKYPPNVAKLAYEKAIDAISTNIEEGDFISNLAKHASVINGSDTHFLAQLSAMTISTACTNFKICTACRAGICSDNVYTESITHSAKPTGTPTSQPSTIDCTPGYYHGSVTPACYKCSSGKYSEWNAYSCNNCTIGTSSLEGTSFCFDCEIGYIAPISGSPKCKKCIWPSTTLTKKSTSCNYTCYCLSSDNLSIATNMMLVLYIFLTLNSGWSRKDQKTVEEKMLYSMRMFFFTVLPLLDFVTDFIYILSTRYAHSGLLAVSMIFTLCPTIYFLKKLYSMGAIMPRLFVPLPFFVTNTKYLLWLRFEKGFPRYVQGWDPPRAQREQELKALIEKRSKETMKHIRVKLEKKIVIAEKILRGYGADGSPPWYAFQGSFPNHDSLPKLFMFWVLWALILALQGISFMIWMFFLAPILLINSPIILTWAILGAYLYQTKCLAIGSSWNVWIAVWCGHSKKKPCPFITEEGKYPHNDPPVDTVLMNESFYAGFIFEAIPQLIIQSINNYLTGEWSWFALFSLASSCSMVCIGTYRYLGLSRSLQIINGVPAYSFTLTDIRKVPLKYSVPAFRPSAANPSYVEFYWISYELDYGTFSDRFIKEFAAQKPWKEVLREYWEDAKKRMLPELVVDTGVTVKLTRQKDGQNIVFELMSFDRKKLSLPVATAKDEVRIRMDDLIPYVEAQNDMFVTRKANYDANISDDEESSIEEEIDEGPKFEQEKALKLLHTVFDADFEHDESDQDSIDEYSDIDPIEREVYLLDSDEEEEKQKKSGWLGFMGAVSKDAVSADIFDDQDELDGDQLDGPAKRGIFKSFNSTSQLNIQPGSDAGESTPSKFSFFKSKFDSPSKKAQTIEKVDDVDEEMRKIFENPSKLEDDIAAYRRELRELKEQLNAAKRKVRAMDPKNYAPTGDDKLVKLTKIELEKELAAQQSSSMGTVAVPNDPASSLSNNEMGKMEMQLRDIQEKDDLERKREISKLLKIKQFQKKANTLEMAEKVSFSVKIADILAKETRTILLGALTEGSKQVTIVQSKAVGGDKYIELLKEIEVGSSIKIIECEGFPFPSNQNITNRESALKVKSKDSLTLTMSQPALVTLKRVKLVVTLKDNIASLSPKKRSHKTAKSDAAQRSNLKANLMCLAIGDTVDQTPETVMIEDEEGEMHMEGAFFSEVEDDPLN